MSKFRALGNVLGIQKTFASEDGKHYRMMSQDLDPVMERVKYLNEYVNESGNRKGKYLGSIPMSMLAGWLEEHNYTFHEFAINAGGEKGKTDPSGPGVKDKFMKYFMSRDFAKLHTQHITNKQSDSGLIYTGD